MLLHNRLWPVEANIFLNFAQLRLYCLGRNPNRRIGHIQDARGLRGDRRPIILSIKNGTTHRSRLASPCRPHEWLWWYRSSERSGLLRVTRLWK
jgi:hypothetical protein